MEEGSGLQRTVTHLEVEECWHLSQEEHSTLVAHALIPLARLHSSLELAHSAQSSSPASQSAASEGTRLVPDSGFLGCFLGLVRFASFTASAVLIWMLLLHHCSPMRQKCPESKT